MTDLYSITEIKVLHMNDYLNHAYLHYVSCTVEGNSQYMLRVYSEPSTPHSVNE